MENKDRKLEKCIYSGRCGGCDFQGIPYKEQLKRKQQTVNGLLSSYGRVEAIVGADNPYNYRNKIHGVFGRGRNGEVFTGIYEEGSHRIVPVKKCQIEDMRAAAIMETLCKLIRSFKLQVYDEDRQTGLFRHVLIRTGYKTGEIMVVLVLSSPVMPGKNDFLKELRRLHSEITTIVLNVNSQRTSMVLGSRSITLFGRGYIEDILCGYRFRISPSSFYQINPAQTEKLYNIAIKAAALTGRERVIDAYCGIGTIGMAAASHAGEVIGVELNGNAVKDAQANAHKAGIKNIKFVCDDAGAFMVKMAAAGKKADVIIMDPPRSGSTGEFIESVRRLGPARVIYVSCNPKTLQRDLRLFTQKDYRVCFIQPVDMFPFSEHTEVVCKLARKQNCNY